MKVVSNSSPLIVLAKLDMLEILKKKFGEIIVPSAVWNEITVDEKQEAKVFNRIKWIKIKEVENKLALDLLSMMLDNGEAEAIILAEEIGADLLLMDDRKGRRIAKQRGLKLKGVVRLLTENAGVEGIEVIFDKLDDAGFRLSDAVKRVILECGE